MSAPEIFCFKCEKSYLVDIRNVKIIGPRIETMCPFCGNFIDRNISKFVDIQIEHRLNRDFRKPSNVRIRKAVFMQKLFVGIEKLVYDD